MKKLCLLSIVCLLVVPIYSQSKQELKTQINELSTDVKKLREELNTLKSEISSLKSEILALQNTNYELRNMVRESKSTPPVEPQQAVSGSSSQCQATTASGKQCSRKADPGSNFCFQHKKTYEPTSTSSSSGSSYKSSSSSTRTIYTGPRGGKYYFNSSGKKVYIK